MLWSTTVHVYLVIINTVHLTNYSSENEATVTNLYNGREVTLIKVLMSKRNLCQ